MIEYRRYPELRNGLAVTAFWKARPISIVSNFQGGMR